MITIHALSLPQTGTLEIHPESRGAMAGSICRFSQGSDTQALRIPIYKGEPSREAFGMNGASHYLDYEIRTQLFCRRILPEQASFPFAANVRLK